MLAPRRIFPPAAAYTPRMTQRMTPARLELVRLTKLLPSGGRSLTILDHVDLRVEPGEFVAVLGPSGSGKSTLFGLAAGLDRPTSGEVRIDGRPIQNLSEDALALLRREKVGFVFQSFQLLGNLTALENVRLPLELAGRPRPADRAAEPLDAAGLAARRHHSPTQLSAGEPQRVALARAFAAEPSLLLADEPTGNLDSANGEMVLGLIESLRRRGDTALVLVTHDRTVADRADRLIFLRDGKIEREERGSAAAGPALAEAAGSGR